LKDSIVITGCGWVTPFVAGGIDAVLRAAAEGNPTPIASEGYWAVSDGFLGGCLPVSAECRNDPGAWLAAVAYELARRDSSLVPGSVPPERVGLVLGNALAGQSGMIDFANDVRQQSPRFVSPIRFPQTVGNFITGALSRAYDIRGPNSTIASGSASGLVAIVEGCALLSAGNVDVIFAGGTERLTPTLAMGLAESGVTFSDGACLFVLERREHAAQRGAAVLATIVPSVDQLRPEPRASARADAAPKASICSVAGPLCALTKYAPTLKGVRANDAIFIEHWIGRCLGALGAAAVAAAIGAARGLPVPCVSEGDSTIVIARTLTDKPCTEPRRVGKNGHIVILAYSEGGPPTRIELAFPP